MCPIRMAISLVAAILFSVFSYSTAAAFSTLAIKNMTGYKLEEVKLVKESKKKASLVGVLSNLANNATSKAIPIKRAGNYRIFVSFTRDGRQVHAKGGSYSIKDGVEVTLTIKEGTLTEENMAVSRITRDEFEDIE